MDRLQRLLDPHLFPAWTMGGLLLLVLLGVRGRRWGSRLAGALLFVLGLVLLGLAFPGSARLGFRLGAEQLPIILWSAATLTMVGAALWRWPMEGGPTDGGPTPRTARFTWSQMTRGAWGVSVVLVLGLVALAVGIGAPLGAPADGAWAPTPVKAPWFLVGLQELAVCFAPWMVRWLFPTAIVLGLMALPFLDRERPAEPPFESRRIALAFVLLATVALWLAPLLIGGLLRGTGGDAAGPAASGALVSWSAGVRNLLGLMTPQGLLLRELPGLLFALLYFAALPWLLAHWHPTRPFLLAARAHLGTVRYGLAMLLALLVVFVPLRLFGCWLLGLGDLIHLPELGLRF